jgi:hypothetical protein
MMEGAWSVPVGRAWWSRDEPGFFAKQSHQLVDYTSFFIGEPAHSSKSEPRAAASGPSL